MPHPNWINELDESLDVEQQALLSINLRAALAKARVETTDDEISLGITRELVAVALTELIPATFANTRYWHLADARKALEAHIEQWRQSEKMTSDNTPLVQRMRVEAARQQINSIGRALWATARLISCSYPISYANPHDMHTPLRIGEMHRVTTDFLTVCQAAESYDHTCVERAISTAVEKINKRF